MKIFETPCHWCLMSSSPYVEIFGLVFLFACIIGIFVAIAQGAKDGLL